MGLTHTHGVSELSVIEEMERLSKRYAELKNAQEAVEDLLLRMEEISQYLPSGIEGSHRADEEWGDTLEQIESEVREIEDRIGE